MGNTTEEVTGAASELSFGNEWHFNQGAGWAGLAQREGAAGTGHSSHQAWSDSKLSQSSSTTALGA